MSTKVAQHRKYIYNACRMLEQLFGSRTRVKLLRLFLLQPDERFFVREIAREIDEQINSVRRELQNLEEMGLLLSELKEKKKYYFVNQEFDLLSELQGLIVKSRLTSEKDFIQSIRGLGPVTYFALTGHFVNHADAEIDMLIVGNVSRTRLKKMLEKFKESFEKDLRYTVMSEEEFKYRKDVTDRFLYSILNGKKIVVVDNTNKQQAVQPSIPVTPVETTDDKSEQDSNTETEKENQ